MKTNNQIATYFLFKDNGHKFFIIVKRTLQRGGFWQPIAGGEEDFDNGDLLTTVIRETKEELGIDIQKKDIIDLKCGHSFENSSRGVLNEYFFGVILTSEEVKKIRLSDEHDSLLCSYNIEYLKTLIPFESCKVALDKFEQIARSV